MKVQKRLRASKDIYFGGADEHDLQQARLKLLTLPKHPATENARSRALVDLASIYWRTGDYVAAVAVWQQQIKVAEAQGDKTALAMLHAALAGTYAHSGDATKAIETAKQALIYDPRNLQALYALSMAYDAAGDYDNSLRWARRLLTFAPDFQMAYEQIGGIYCRLGDFAQAEKYLRRALELDPKSITGLNELGNMYIAQARYTEALAQFDAAQRAHRDEPNSHNNRGNCYLHMGRLAEARRSYEQRIKLYPADAFSAHIGMGVIERQDPTPQARERSDAHFRRALEIHASKEARLLARLLEHEARRALALTGLGDEQALVVWQAVLADPQLASVGPGACKDWLFVAEKLAHCPHPPPRIAEIVALLAPLVQKPG